MTVNKIRLCKEDRISKILDAAVEIIARDGFKQASTKEIAKLASCTEALVYKYFKTKEDILDCITKTMFAYNDSEFLVHFDEKKDLKTVLINLSSWYIDEYSANKNLYKVIYRHQCLNIEYNNYINNAVNEKRLKPIIEDCKKRQKNGEIKAGLDTTILGALIREIIYSSRFKILFLDADPEIEKINYIKMISLLVDSVKC